MRDVFIIAFIGLTCIQMSRSQRKPPNYSLDAMPVTDFDCQDKIVGGYYADPQTECQMFHVCTDISGVLQDFRFLCPNNTAFDQENQICDDWYNIDCEAATLFYSDNFDLFRIDADTRSNSIVNKVTPIPLGPSTSAKPKVVKPKKPLGSPVNNAVTDDEDDQFLQKADTGDRRLHQDLLRGSSSSNFFENKNRGREDFDDDLTGQRKSNFIKPSEDGSKKKTKVAVRKLLTGKRPVSPKAETTSEAPPPTTQNFQPSTTSYQNNFFQKSKYNTVNRNRDSATASTRTFDASTTAAPSTQQAATNSRVFNNNYNQKQYNYYSKTTTKNNDGQSTRAPHFKSRGSVNYNTYLKSQTNADFIDIPKTSAAPVYNPYQPNNYKQTSQTPAPYSSPDITQAYFNYQTPSTQNVQPTTSNQKSPVYQKQQTNYQQPQTNNYQQSQQATNNYQQPQQATNNYQQPQQVTNNYQQPQQVANNYQQPQQQTVLPNVNYQPYNVPAAQTNYFQKTTQASQPVSQNYQQPSTVNQPVYQQPAIVSPTNYQQPPAVSQNYQQPSTVNQYFQASTPSPTTQSPAFNNYYQQYSTASPSSAYQTSTSFAFSPSSTAAPPVFQKANYYQPKKDYSPKAQIAPVYQFNPSEDKYEENNPDEFLKTAPSSNLRPSDINALGNYNKPSFNTSVSASFKFSQNSASKSSTAYTPSSTKAPIYNSNSVSYNLPPVRSSPKPFTLPASTTLAPKPITNKPKAIPPQPSLPILPAGGPPNQQQTSGKDDYDYAYYDDGTSEYDGVEHIQEEFHKTKTIKKA